MSENYRLKPEGTGRLASWDSEKIYGQRTAFYRCSASLPYNASVKRYLGVALDTIDYDLPGERSSSESFIQELKKDEPALNIIDEEQKGHALTFQRWKGIVKSIASDTFVAQLTDLSENVPDEEAEFLCSEIQDDDKELLSVGAAFYWCIGYVYSRSSQVIRASFLRFQRLPLYSSDSIRIAAQKAKDIQDNIIWR